MSMFRRAVSASIQRLVLAAAPLAAPVRFASAPTGGKKNPPPEDDEFSLSEDDMWFMDEMLGFGEGGADNMDFVPPEEATILKSERR